MSLLLPLSASAQETPRPPVASRARPGGRRRRARSCPPLVRVTGVETLADYAAVGRAARRASAPCGAGCHRSGRRHGHLPRAGARRQRRARSRARRRGSARTLRRIGTAVSSTNIAAEAGPLVAAASSQSDLPRAHRAHLASTDPALQEGDYYVALALFTVAAVSDGLDGYLAKRFNWTSELGKILDPLADKLLLVVGVHRRHLERARCPPGWPPRRSRAT